MRESIMRRIALCRRKWRIFRTSSIIFYKNDYNKYMIIILIMLYVNIMYKQYKGFFDFFLFL